MTEPNMKSRSPALMTLMASDTYFRPTQSADSEPSQTEEALRAFNPGAAANDDAPRKWYQIRNPLWVVVIGMGFMFAVMALIVALG
jgi:hypothetical protein